MRIFTSYARVDKRYCEQIVAMLEAHEVWYDRRVHVGKHWWDEILQHLKSCQGFLYLLSPDSVKSEYCKREFDIARSMNKHIFPVLIHNRTAIPEALKGIPIIDLSKGLTSEGVKNLLSALHIAERRGVTERQPIKVAIPVPSLATPSVNHITVIDEFAEAMEANEIDRAVFLLKNARANGYKSEFINIDSVIKEAEALLEEQAYLREAEREYQPIAALVRRELTRQLGFKAFQAFREHFPDYDPDNISALCAQIATPKIDWCDIPAGEIEVVRGDDKMQCHVEPFRMSMYPITNDDFQMFANAADGYADARWWDFSPQARQWRKEHTRPTEPKFVWSDHPRANVCWYEAMAFCRWLSYLTGTDISLPTEEQWQRAAQGDDNRLYPWGSEFDVDRCNTAASMIRMTTPVTRYENGLSAYGVCDMAGNVWEWCLNEEPSGATDANSDDVQRAVRGGSFISSPQRSQTTFHFYLNPNYLYTTIGFRVVSSVNRY